MLDRNQGAETFIASIASMVGDVCDVVAVSEILTRVATFGNTLLGHALATPRGLQRAGHGPIQTDSVSSRDSLPAATSRPPYTSNLHSGRML